MKTPKNPTILLTLTALSVAVLILSNIASVKLVTLAGITIDAGTLLFPLAYIVGDIIAEIYGYRMARRIVLIGAGSLLLMSATLMAVQYLPSSSFFDGQAAYERILGVAPRIAIASLAAYILGELSNAFVLARLKASHKKQLWGRLIGSSVVGEALDTVTFSVIAFAGVLPITELLWLIGTVYLLKIGFEIVVSPLTIRVIARIKQYEKIDVTEKPRTI